MKEVDSEVQVSNRIISVNNKAHRNNIYDIDDKDVSNSKLVMSKELLSIIGSIDCIIMSLINRCIGHLDNKSMLLLLEDHGIKHITNDSLNVLLLHLRKIQIAKTLLHAAEYRARKKKIKCTLDYEWIYNRLSKCEKTCIPFRFTERNDDTPNPYAPSIDRIDNDKGYLKSNSRLVLISYNKFKCDYHEDDINYIVKELSLLSL